MGPIEIRRYWEKFAPLFDDSTKLKLCTENDEGAYVEALGVIYM